MRLVVSVGALASLIITAPVATASPGSITPHGGQPIAPLDAPARYLVLMVLDGARPDYFHLAALPHVDALMRQGTVYTRAMSGILESETPAGHATISTGSTPRRSGILGFTWAANDQRVSLFSPVVVRAGAIEHFMEQAHAPTIAGLYKARFPHAVVAALSGYKYYAADPLGGPSADDIMYLRGTLQNTFTPTAIPGHVPPASVFNVPSLTQPLKTLKFGEDDGMATQLALSAFRVQRPRITLINYPDFDWPLGHVYGGISARARATTLMRDFDRDLGLMEDAYQRAGVLNQTLWVVTADHGMSPIKRFIPDSIFTDAVARAGTTAPEISYNTATYIWLRNQARARAVAANIIARRDPGIQSVYYLAPTKHGSQYTRAAGPALNAGVDAANRFLLATLENGHQPQVVAFCRRRETSSSTSTHWRADHGGASWGVQHVPLILAGPGIRSGQVISAPAQLEDVAPTALVDMGVRPVGMEGHVLDESLVSPFAADGPKRNREISRITPLVQAMIAEEKRESP